VRDLVRVSKPYQLIPAIRTGLPAASMIRLPLVCQYPAPTVLASLALAAARLIGARPAVLAAALLSAPAPARPPATRASVPANAMKGLVSLMAGRLQTGRVSPGPG
jgi:hypothetical protein